MGLPPHTTHILQPLDVGVFSHVKRKFHEVCLAVGKRSARYTVMKNNFPIAWKNSLEQGATKKVIQSAFQRSGLHPFDPTAIDLLKVQNNYRYSSYILHIVQVIKIDKKIS